MGFQQGLSGLNAASKALDTISHNIANAGTVGYKEQRTEFADVYSGAMAGGSSLNQVGMGVNVASVSTQFNQGAFTSTNNPLDMAVNGDGFFMVSHNGATSYTRDGQFHTNLNGELVTSENDLVLGYGVNNSGQILPGTPQPLVLSKAPMAPVQTVNSTAAVNLDSRLSNPTAAWAPSGAGAFAPNPDSFNYTMSQTVYDSQGSAHTMEWYYVKTGANTWDAYASMDGSQPGNIDLGNGAGNPIQMTFGANGALTSPIGNIPVTVNTAGVTADVGTNFPAAGAWSMNTTMAGSTQIASSSAVLTSKQDGNAPGVWTGWVVDNTGRIQGKYSNGQLSWVGQISLARFENTQGLTHLGNNLYSDTYASGAPLVGTPGSGTLGGVQNNMTEDSTVDLTRSMVDMITQQRNYQANAQVIKTQDALVQTLLNLR